MCCVYDECAACILQHLDLELSEGFELWLEAGDELSALRNLRSLTISGTTAAASSMVGNTWFDSCTAGSVFDDIMLEQPPFKEVHTLRRHTCPHMCMPCCLISRSGGVFTVASAERLLRCLAVACPLLEELHVLPEPTCGLGDDQVDHLLALTALKVRH